MIKQMPSYPRFRGTKEDVEAMHQWILDNARELEAIVNQDEEQDRIDGESSKP